MIKKTLVLCSIFLFFIVNGCGPVLVAGGAAGAYKVATDERNVGEIWDDSAIEAQINLEFVRASGVNTANIDVDVVDGFVFLTGVVDSVEEAEKAEAIARNEPHVKEVKNQLMIGSRSFGQIIDDQVIGNKVKGALINEKGIRSLNIDVDVQKGVVFLTGIVENEDQHKRVLRIAEATSGAVKVTDNLKIRKSNE
ncbi:MAG: BON domain-containing protein [Deltaproteobacteria bacterium]|nr:BON domain-containing protein [Deltaproteobacteria bacterium]